MEYKGKLYARIGGQYFDLGVTSEDYDKLLKENKELKNEIQNGKKTDCSHNNTVFQMRRCDVCEDCGEVLDFDC